MQSNATFDDFREFYSHRWALNYGDTAEKETPEFWNDRSADFAAKAHSPEARAETLEFLKQFAWSNDETVLDVAAGPGTFAIPLARVVKKVTATDFSKGMIEELKKRAIAENVNNISVIEGRWLDLKLPETFSTVLCLNSLGVISTDENHESQLIEALKKLRDACSERLIMLIPHADSPLDAQLRKNIGIEEIPIERRRIAILYYAMIDCGMLPSLNIINRPFRWIFKNPLEARETLLKKAGVTDPDKAATAAPKIDTYLQTAMKRDSDGRFTLAYNVSQALYTWHR
ncbi:MAG: class I SAM-dependent methyltransferase [Candidatus Riflebacteria bacterium]|nr:class I SAM-dependent methyltransferase [Candidatus Riflebacteria bacterium]